MNILVVVDMQNDFVSGSLANSEASKIVTKIADLVRGGDYDEVICTMDTHSSDYLNTAEGKKLPIPHCIANTDGAKIVSEISKAAAIRFLNGLPVDYIVKNSFGSEDLLPLLKKKIGNSKDENHMITFVGTCTDICVVSNALAVVNKIQNTEVEVIADACAGTTIENHNAALTVMKNCQINVV